MFNVTNDLRGNIIVKKMFLKTKIQKNDIWGKSKNVIYNFQLGQAKSILMCVCNDMRISGKDLYSGNDTMIHGSQFEIETEFVQN